MRSTISIDLDVSDVLDQMDLDDILSYIINNIPTQKIVDELNITMSDIITDKISMDSILELLKFEYIRQPYSNFNFKEFFKYIDKLYYHNLY